MRVLIVGCGYVGVPLGAELIRQGHEVFGVRRSAEAKSELDPFGIRLTVADITRTPDLEQLPGPFDWVINTVSAGGAGSNGYREVYLEGTRNLIKWLGTTPPKKYVYTSSTSVYGQTDGSGVKEDSATEPSNETGRILFETEKLLLGATRESKFPAVILRAAGIYGPDRGYWFRQYLANMAKIEGKGDRILNMIHRDDLVGIIIAALKSGRVGEIYNAVDNEPVTQLHFFRWLADSLGTQMPPFGPEAGVEERKRGWSNKKVLNRKLMMELGYQFKYPTFRQGFTAEIQRLEDAGQLNLQVELK